MNRTHQQILQLALPAIVTNITVPLLGLVDSAIVGHMGSAVYIGAVAVGAMVFNLVYWVFGFLRMGTSGLTAQARGRRDMAGAGALLRRSATVSLAIAALIVALQWPLRELMLWFIAPTPDVRPLAVAYYNIVVWGAPAVLGLYSLTGWFIGMQNTRLPMLVSILQNVVNIVASLCLVYGLGWRIEGVAVGTLVAQYAGFLVAGALLWRYYRKPLRLHRTAAAAPVCGGGSPVCGGGSPVGGGGSSFAAFFRVNRDIFLRTLCLVAVNLYFTAAGARQGATVLAVNTLLMQLYLLFSYVMDGFAYAGEALGGRYWGAQNRGAFRDVVRRLFHWGAAMTLLFTMVYVLGGMPFLRLLTDEPSVVEASRQYVWWAYLIPAAGVAAFVWDGIFIGITATRGMLLSSAVATLVSFLSVLLLLPALANHALWLAQLLYLATRGTVQTAYYVRHCLPS